MALRGDGKLDALAFVDIELEEGCEVILRRDDDQHYAGSTREGVCRSELRGASHATSEVVVTTERVDSWDRGYDEAGTPPAEG